MLESPITRLGRPVKTAGRVLRRTGFLLVWVALMLAGLEAGTWALTRLHLLRAPQPIGGRGSFWDTSRPGPGVWHQPFTGMRHTTPCFDVVYRANSVGARDVERQRRSAARRVVVLGDSIVEGWGLELEERLSGRLEAATGIEHLNFAMAHFGPYQDYLAYRQFASPFDHTAVLVGIYPSNDLFDLDYEAARKAPGYEYRYRRYLVGDYPNYRVVDYREGRLRALLRRYSYAYNALSNALFLWTQPPPPPAPEGEPGSRFYDFTDAELDRLRFCMERIVEAASGRPVVVVLMPALPDFRRYDLHKGQPVPLAERLAAVSGKGGFRVVDLLPAMHDATRDWRGYHFPCDHHWSAKANAVAAGRLQEVLRGVVY
jgi:hypothetical protein